LRKSLIVAIAALTVVAFSAVAYAQSGGATLDTKVTPVDAGTKQKPKNSTFTLDVVNDDTQRTMSELDVYLAKNVTLSLKGMPECAAADIFALSCPKSTVLGKGEAVAKVGVNGPPENIRDLTFKVTAYKTESQKNGKDMLGFFIDDGASLKFLAETTIKKASGKYGQVLNIEVPELAQRVGTAPNFTYNGLVSLDAKLGKKKGKNMLISTTGCANKKHPYRTVLTFIDNTIKPAGTADDTDTTACKK
jgi:hypothetical protein